MIAPFSCCAGERHAHDLLDDLIRTCQHSLGDREPEGLGGLEIDDEVERVELLDWQVSGVGAEKNALDLLFLGGMRPKFREGLLRQEGFVPPSMKRRLLSSTTRRSSPSRSALMFPVRRL